MRQRLCASVTKEVCNTWPVLVPLVMTVQSTDTLVFMHSPRKTRTVVRKSSPSRCRAYVVASTRLLFCSTSTASTRTLHPFSRHSGVRRGCRAASLDCMEGMQAATHHRAPAPVATRETCNFFAPVPTITGPTPRPKRHQDFKLIVYRVTPWT